MRLGNVIINNNFEFVVLKEVKLNLSLFMLAGYETTSTTLSYCTYILATHPEEQQKLLDEINYANKNDEESNFAELNADTIQKYEYLDMFIKEVLFLFEFFLH